MHAYFLKKLPIPSMFLYVVMIMHVDSHTFMALSMHDNLYNSACVLKSARGIYTHVRYNLCVMKCYPKYACSYIKHACMACTMHKRSMNTTIVPCMLHEI